LFGRKNQSIMPGHDHHYTWTDDVERTFEL